jgi:hypothetical protein
MRAQIRFEHHGVILPFHFLKVFMRKIMHQLLVIGKTFSPSSVHSVTTEKKGGEFRKSETTNNPCDSPTTITYH